MKRRNSGFTIIEVTLFLALTGALTVGLFAVASNSIQRQQYKDAVQSFASHLRDEYARVISVENDRDNGQSCPIDDADDNVSSRGQSNCVIVGRYIAANNNGTEYLSYPVYAKSTAAPSGNSWNYSYDTSQSTVYDMNWGAKSRISGTPSDSLFSFLMYRNPDTGRISIHSDNKQYNPDQIKEIIGLSSESNTQSSEICVYDDGWFNSERQSVFLAERAGSGDSITVASATEGCSD